MRTPDPRPPDPPRPAPPRRSLPRIRLPRIAAPEALLAALALLLLLLSADTLPPLETTDARYLLIARETLHSPEPLVPTLNGIVHLHKPPFVYRLMALAMRASGDDGAFGGRLAVALAALLSLLLLHRFARAAAGPLEARLATLALLTTPLFLASSRGASSDPFLLPCQILALSGYFLHLRSGLPRDRAAFWTGLALAFLVKGPAGILPPVCIVLADRLLPGARLPWRPLAHPAPVACALALAALPYLALAHKIPGLLPYLVFEQVGSRLAEGGLGHPRPFHYFAWVAPLAALPWIFFLPEAARGAFRSPLPRFALLWCLVPVALFSLPATKLPLYILPAAPGLALLVALHLAAAARGRPASRLPAAATALLGLAVAAAALALALPGETPLPLRRALFTLAALALASALFAARAATLRRPTHHAAAAALTVALLAAGLLLSAEPFEGRFYRSGRPFARALADHAAGAPFTLYQHRLYFASLDLALRSRSVHVDFARDLRFQPGGSGEILLSRDDFRARAAASAGRAYLFTRTAWRIDYPDLPLEPLLERDGYSLFAVGRP